MKFLLPYIPLRIIPHATRFVGDKVKEVVFVTRPNYTKVELKNYLEALYGLDVEQVNTANYEGKKIVEVDSKTKMRQFKREPHYKKAFVTLKEPVEAPLSLLEEYKFWGAKAKQYQQKGAIKKKRKDQQRHVDKHKLSTVEI